MIKANLAKKKLRKRKQPVFKFETQKRYRITWTNLTRKVSSTGMIISHNVKLICIVDERLNSPLIIPVNKIIDLKPV